MDLAEDALAELDIVVGSVHSHMNLEAAEMTDRLMRALESPSLRVMGHPTGRMLLNRDPFPFDFERVASEAARRNVYLEINGSPERLDLGGAMVRTAKRSARSSPSPPTRTRPSTSASTCRSAY
jgi:DNA polymerase (family 10)